MRRQTLPLTLAALLSMGLVGCATNSRAAASLPERSVVTTPDPFVSLVMVRDNRGILHEIAADRSQVWRALIDAFGDLGITLGTIDATDGIVGNRQLALSHQLNNSRLSTFFQCGTGITGIPTADEASLRASVLGIVRSVDPTTTELEVRVTAYAIPRGSGGTIQCETTGELERRIVNWTTVRLVG